MIYVITNLTHTSDDQHRRGHRLREFRKGRVQIGPRSIDEGRSASFSEEMYNQYKARIDHYVEIGMIRVEVFGAGAPSSGETAATEELVSTPELIAEAPAVVEVPEEPEVTEETPAANPAPESVEDTAPLAEEAPADQPAKRKGRPPKEK